MKQYLTLLNDIMENGHEHPDRTGTGRRSIFGTQLRFNLSEGLPLVTTRSIFTRGMIRELLWFISGGFNANELSDDGVHIWDKWKVDDEAVEKYLAMVISDDQPGSEQMVDAIRKSLASTYKGSVGPLYGSAWRLAPAGPAAEGYPAVTEDMIASDKLAKYREYYETNQPVIDPQTQTEVTFEQYINRVHYGHVDQLQNVIYALKTNPYSARHVISAWIPQWLAFESVDPKLNVLLNRGALAPCHVLQQYFVSPPKEEGGKMRLSLQMYQRSADTPVGVPYNIAQYSILLSMIAQVVGMEPFEFIWTGGDTHVYLDQKELVAEQLSREPFKLPTLKLNPEITDLFAFTAEDIEIVDYQSHEKIPYPVSE